jgi:hypothetical protein
MYLCNTVVNRELVHAQIYENGWGKIIEIDMGKGNLGILLYYKKD